MKLDEIYRFFSPNQISLGRWSGTQSSMATLTHKYKVRLKTFQETS